MQKYSNILFIDIETVPAKSDYSSLGTRDKELFEKKFAPKIKEVADANPSITYPDICSNYYNSNAAFLAEFSKICAIAVGFLNGGSLRIKSMASRNEIELINSFIKLVTPQSATPVPFSKLCAHNGKNFDIPFLIRRMIVNNIRIPDMLDIAGKKPWDIPHIDTIDLWAAGQFNYRCSLDLLCNVLGIQSPKQEMDGSMVKDVYYGTYEDSKLPWEGEEERMKAIADYCGQDIVALVNVFLRLSGESIIPEDKVIYA